MEKNKISNIIPEIPPNINQKRWISVWNFHKRQDSLNIQHHLKISQKFPVMEGWFILNRNVEMSEKRKNTVTGIDEDFIHIE